MKRIISLILIILIFSIVGYRVGLEFAMRSLPEDVFEKTEHYIPSGYADKYWNDSFWQDGLHINYYELSEKEILKLESEINSDKTLWKSFSREALNLFEKKIVGAYEMYDEIKEEHFRNGDFYYCSCEEIREDFTYFDITKEDPNIIYLDRTTWFFIYNSNKGKYYIVHTW